MWYKYNEVLCVFEKLIISTLKGFSAVIYVLVMLALFSVPVLFIWQAFVPPEFVLESINVPESLENDTYIKNKSDSWHRIDFIMTASSGKISPYSYKIDEFKVKDTGILKKYDSYKLVLDAPLEFTNVQSDSFVLSLYIYSEQKPDFEEIAEGISFSAVNYEKSFSQFAVIYE